MRRGTAGGSGGLRSGRRSMRYRRHGAMEDAEGFSPITAEEQEVLLRVVEQLRRLHFGTILLVVQDGKVVQIETAERIRLR